MPTRRARTRYACPACQTGIIRTGFSAADFRLNRVIRLANTGGYLNRVIRLANTGGY